TVVVHEAPGAHERASTLRQGTADVHRPQPAERHVARGQDLHAPRVPPVHHPAPTVTGWRRDGWCSATSAAAERSGTVAAARGAVCRGAAALAAATAAVAARTPGGLTGGGLRRGLLGTGATTAAAATVAATA